MEGTVSSVTISLALVAFLTCVWRVVRRVWLRPKQLEKCLREQGFRGNSYRLLYGDSKEMVSMLTETKTTSINTTSDYVLPFTLPFHHRFSKLFGKNYFVWMGITPKVNIEDPELVKEILLKYDAFQKPNFGPIGKFIMTGLVAAEGEKWVKHRNLLNPAFHLEKLKNMVPAMYSCCGEMISKWEELVSATAPFEVDVWPYLSDLSADVISHTAFGSNYKEGKRIFELQMEQSQLNIQLLRSLYIPGWRLLPTKANKRVKQIHAEIENLLRHIIYNKERAIKEGIDGHNDLLGILLTSNMEEIQLQGNKPKLALGIEEVMGDCKLFYAAGKDTVSSLLLWTMVLLSNHQKWQALAREEVFTVFGDREPDDFNGFSRLKIVPMILYEVLRLYPPLGSLVRSVPTKAKIKDYVMPPGVEISIPIIAIHTNPKIWGEDALDFKPERFSEGVYKATNNQPIFLPFGAGPRVCIGKNFAMLEAKMSLAMILKRFSFHLSPSYVHCPSPAVSIMVPQRGAPLMLQKI